MDAIGDGIGKAVGDFFGNPATSLFLSVIAAYAVVVWLAVALWAFVDMRRRTSNPIVAYASAAKIILASPVFFVPALLVHRVIRPANFSSERRVAHLREAALEAETVALRCPECRRVVDEEWLICPTCRRALGHHCQACGSTVEIDWSLCAWCGVDLEAAVRPVSIAMRA